MRLRRTAAEEREAVASERAALAAERAELDRSRSTDDAYDEYVDSPAKAFRKWAETIRGEKFASDDEYKAEVADFVTLLSGDVMGVPLPENVRIRIEAQNSKKAIKMPSRAFCSSAKPPRPRDASKKRSIVSTLASADLIGQQFSPWHGSRQILRMAGQRRIAQASSSSRSSNPLFGATALSSIGKKPASWSTITSSLKTLRITTGARFCSRHLRQRQLRPRAASRTHPGSLQQGHRRQA